MKIKFYYNLTCPHCFVVLKNLIQASENCQIDLDIEFVPTDLRSDDEEEIKKFLPKYQIEEKFIFERGHDLSLVNRVLLYANHKVDIYKTLADAYFYDGKDITNEEVLRSLLQCYSNEDFEEIKKINLSEYITTYQPTTIEIGDVRISGVKDVGYYEFALSCFYNVQREVVIEEDEECCEGNCCG